MKLFRKHGATILGLLVSGFAVVWLARQFDLHELVVSLKAVNPWVLLPIPVLVVISFGLRAQRWRLLVEHQPPVRYWPSFSALMIGYLLNNLLPARAGDFARAIELGRTEKISRTKVFATLVTERTLDLLAALSILALVLLSYPALPAWLKSAGIAVAMVAGGAATFLVVAHLTGRRWLPGLVSLVARRFPHPVRAKLDQMTLSALDGIAGMFRPARAAGFLLLTVLLWVIEVAIVYLVGGSLQLELPPGNALFVLLVLAIGSMVPSSPGFVGTYEFFGVAALALVGIQGSMALAFVVLLHVLTLLGSTLIGVCCLLFRRTRPGSEPSVETGI